MRNKKTSEKLLIIDIINTHKQLHYCEQLIFVVKKCDPSSIILNYLIEGL